MKRTRPLLLLLTLALIVSPLTVLAQDDDMEMQEFVSMDERLTLLYPADWIAFEDDEVPVPNVVVGNTENAVESATTNEGDLGFGEDDIAVALLLLPTDFMALLGVEMPEEPDLDLAMNVVEAFVLTGDADLDADITLSDAEEVELDDERTAGFIEISDEDQDGAFVVFILADDLIALAYVATGVGGYDDADGDLLIEIASSIAFDGTGAEIMTELMADLGGEDDTGDDMDDEDMAEDDMGDDDMGDDDMGDDDMGDDDMGDDDMGDDDASQGSIDGATLVTERCTVCHSAARITSADKDEAGWTATVDRMISYGANLNDAERAALIDYLVATQ